MRAPQGGGFPVRIAFAFVSILVLALASAVALVCTAFPVLADEARYPQPPGEREFILDEANLIAAEHAVEIRRICTALLDEKRVPILVVTLPSLATYGAGEWPIERYAMNLFDEWGIGFPEWNHGMLLLVSKGDRKARIELGDAWGREQDRQTRRIMDETIVASFKQGRFTEGILAGVEALADVARGLAATAPAPDPRRARGGEASRPWYANAFWWGLGLFVLGSVLSVVQRGREGWGYKAWAAIFMILGALLMILSVLSVFSGRGGGSRGGSSGGGGSFGGGSSGGGGATGSW